MSRDEAYSSFGDGRMFIEKYFKEPRHIEYQILDEHGNYEISMHDVIAVAKSKTINQF